MPAGAVHYSAQGTRQLVAVNGLECVPALFVNIAEQTLGGGIVLKSLGPGRAFQGSVQLTVVEVGEGEVIENVGSIRGQAGRLRKIYHGFLVEMGAAQDFCATEMEFEPCGRWQINRA